MRVRVPSVRPYAMTCVGPLVVDVHLHERRATGHQHALAHRLEVPLDGRDLQAGAGGRLEDEHGLIPERLVLERVDPVADRGPAAGRGRRAGAVPGTPPSAVTARPRAAASAPWNRRNRPWPPESTTCASRRMGSSVGVRATDRSAASTSATRTFSTSLSRSAAATAAADDSRMTVRIVPSTGFATAL